MTRPRLSVLDAGTVPAGVEAVRAPRWTTELALAVESLGYARMWVIEHHASADIGASLSAVLLAHLAASTRTLHLGFGGLAMSGPAPRLIAEQVALLEALHPGRVDLGVGCAPPAARAATRARDDAAFETRLDELAGLLRRRTPPRTDPSARALPELPLAPPLFVLGAGEGSAGSAARRGLSFAFAHHLRPRATRAVLAHYRHRFRSAGTPRAAPWTIMTIAVVCGDERGEAEQAALRTVILRLRRTLAIERGRDVDERSLARVPFSDAERRLAVRELAGDWIVVGGRARVARALLRLAETAAADEIMLVPFELDGPGRLRTLRAVAGAFDPAPGPGRAAGAADRPGPDARLTPRRRF